MQPAADDQFSAGFSQITVSDPGGGDHFRAALWYPTKAREARVTEQFFMFSVARDAMPARGSYPLILLSHGSGSWFGAHYDTAELLARRGYVVAAVTHPGDNHKDLSGYLGAQQLIGRPRHMQLTLDYVLGTHKYGSIIDAERIGAMGFSEGGYTVVVLMGGRPDFARFAEHARFHGDDPVLLPHWELMLKSVEESHEPAHDERISSAVLMAPALGFLFDRYRLQTASAQVRLYRAEMDHVLRADTHVEPYLRALPRVPEYRIVKGAGHYAFLAPCPERVAEEDPDICRDRRGFDRVAFHQRLNEEIFDYLTRTLGSRETRDAYGLERTAMTLDTGTDGPREREAD
jgi:predicted dienelactone hydrolase